VEKIQIFGQAVAARRGGDVTKIRVFGQDTGRAAGGGSHLGEIQIFGQASAARHGGGVRKIQVSGQDVTELKNTTAIRANAGKISTPKKIKMSRSGSHIVTTKT
jgi:hypothetical protein